MPCVVYCNYQSLWRIRIWMPQKWRKRMSFTLNFQTLSENCSIIGNTFMVRWCSAIVMTLMKVISLSILHFGSINLDWKNWYALATTARQCKVRNWYSVLMERAIRCLKRWRIKWRLRRWRTKTEMGRWICRMFVTCCRTIRMCCRFCRLVISVPQSV